MWRVDAQLALPLPAAALHAVDHGSVVEVRRGGFTITAYPKNDLGLRNLAVVSLTESGVSCKTAATLLGLRQARVSQIRADYRARGSAGLAKKTGRPPLLSQAQVRQARAWAGQGVKHGEIARRLGVSRPLIVALLKRHGKIDPQEELGPPPAGPFAEQDASDEDDARQEEAGQDEAGQEDVCDQRSADKAGQDEAGQDEAGEDAAAGEDNEAGAVGSAQARPIRWGTYPSRHAGAMLTHAFTSAIGAQDILASVCGLDGSDAAADLMALNAARVGFTLGALTIEATKHLASADAGPLIGLTRLPSMRAWRARLGAIGDAADPLELQRRLVAAMLAFGPAHREVFLADDHHVEYTGGKPVGWGRNPRRGKPTKGHGDTYTTDLGGRALVFATGEPSSLSATLPGVLDQLTAARPAANRDRAGADPGHRRRPMVVFDRGGSYPKTFTAVHKAGYQWLTWRRAPLAPAAGLPVAAAIRQYGRDRHVAYTDERVSVPGYHGPVRQITLFERGEPVAQLLTSDLEACAGLLLCLLRARWIIENVLKYNAANYGIDTLADYLADYIPDDRKTANPAHQDAKSAEKAAAAALADAQTSLADLLADPAISPAEKNTTLIPAIEKEIAARKQALETAAAARKKLPAKIARDQLHEGAQRALLRPGRRCLQLVLRLLAANAEHHLADRLNVHLRDDDEYRAITRETILRGLGGEITYTPKAITVTLERPSQPRVHRALAGLLDEINRTPPAIPGDTRPITYRLAAQP